MASKRNTFEAGAGSITTANSNRPDAFDVVVGSMTYSSTRAAHGSRSGLVTTSTTPSSSYLQWALSSAGQHYSRMYVYFAAAPEGNHRLLQFFNGAGSCGDLEIRTDMSLRLRNAYSALQVAATNLPLNKWIRVECRILFQEGTGSASLRLFWTDNDGTTANFSADTAADGTYRGIPTGVRFGAASNVANASFNLDDLAVGDEAWFGPANLRPRLTITPPAAVSVGEACSATVGVTEEDSYTIAWAVAEKPAGSSMTLASTAPTVNVTPDVAGSYVLAAVVSDAQGGISIARTALEAYDLTPVPMRANGSTTPLVIHWKA